MVNSTTGAALTPGELQARVEFVGAFAGVASAGPPFDGEPDDAAAATAGGGGAAAPPYHPRDKGGRGGRAARGGAAKAASPASGSDPRAHRFVIVLRVQSANPAHVFSLKTGDRVYRVNASNRASGLGGNGEARPTCLP